MSLEAGSTTSPRRWHCSRDYAEQVALGVGEDHEVGVFRIVPVDPPCAERDESLNLGLLIRALPIHPQVEVRPVALVQVKTWTLAALGREKFWILRLANVSEGLGPELRRPANV